MATATSSRRFLLGLALTGLIALALTACGAANHHRSRAAGRSGAFSWLRPAASPAGWKIARLPSGKAALAYPPGWRAIKTDPGTVSAAISGRTGRIRGYLNATPQSGAENLANWASFAKFRC